jgi:phospholipid/cholesterol/gamma-HCH transport system substrate-binding protein
MNRKALSTAVGATTVFAIAGVFALAAMLFRGGLTTTVPVTVISDRAGLVMNPDAKVKLHDVAVGRVTAIDSLPDGQAALHLALEPSAVTQIPANVDVDITSSTVFGAKFVRLVPPAEPSGQRLQADQVLTADHVTVEINTVFEQLTRVLAKIDPAKLSQTLGAIASAVDGRGAQFGQALTGLHQVLSEIEPSLGKLSHDIDATAAVTGAYADAAPDLMTAVNNADAFSHTVVDTQHDLDAFLVASTGLADIGNQVIGDNRQGITDVAHLLVPTTGLLARYHEQLGCALGALSVYSKLPALPTPGIPTMVTLQLGIERYRYPQDLPKVAAKNGATCQQLSLPHMPPETRPPFVIADVGTNRFKYNNQGILLNSDRLKQYLFGPVDGPPRNTMQIGQPG